MARSEREGPVKPSKKQLEWRGHEPFFNEIAVFPGGISNMHDRDIQKLLATTVPALVDIAEDSPEGNKMVNVFFKRHNMNEDLLPNHRPITPPDRI